MAWTTIYACTGDGRDGRPVGRMEADGTVYDAEWGGSAAGRVDGSGAVYGSPWYSTPVGRVERDGSVHEGFWGSFPAGSVDGDGLVLLPDGSPAGFCAGQGWVDETLAGAAALLLGLV